MDKSVVLAVLTGAAENTTRKNRWKNPKRYGELSEAAFVLKAQNLGFLVSKPWGESEKYDFILDSGPDCHSRLWRVQLKSTAAVDNRAYPISAGHNVYGKGKVGYTADEIDVLVVHIRPRDVWYVLPIEAFTPTKHLRFYPDTECKRARWESYREAWELLRGKPRQIAGDAKPRLTSSP